MEYNSELIRRIEDLGARCERTGSVTASDFLTPAEQYQVRAWLPHRSFGCTAVFSGGHPACERAVAFFLPDYLEPEYFTPDEYIRAIRITAHFGEPGHRDYMGALLGMGIDRGKLGDIWVSGPCATVFCLNGIYRHLLGIEKAGRISVTAAPADPAALTPPERRTEETTFSVMSPRLDAVAAGMFRISRSEAARLISLGSLSVNYEVSNKVDLTVKPGDVLSLRGSGKGTVTSIGGTSRKGRTFVTAELLK